MAFEKYTLHRYDHGGGRLFVIDEEGRRDLILDLYGDGERRDRILDALMAAEVIPPKSHIEIIDV